MIMRWIFAFSTLCLVACSQNDPENSATGESCDPDSNSGGTTSPRVEPQDELTPLRLLRRASIALRGVPPTDDEMGELLANESAADQFAYVDAFIVDALEDPRFYDVMVEFSRKWFNIPFIDRTADAPEYGPKQQRVLTACAAGTMHAGSLRYFRDDLVSADTACNGPGPVTSVEPWWAPGTTVTLVGSAANTTNQGQINSNGSPKNIECNGRADGTCGCYTNASSCWYDPGTYPGWAAFIPGNPDGQRHLLAEEPARLFAHIVWHDRPITDLILADYSVGPTEVQAAYVNQSLAGGNLDVVSDASWWNPTAFAGAIVDPHHDAKDPKAWREYSLSARNTFFLKERDYKFDPRKDPGLSKGFPSAGMLTSLGFLNAYPRERLRAARALETLACELLLPPGGDVQFNPYLTDPGREGPCQHCHTRIDTAALHFKRYAKAGSAFEGWGARYYMPGVGSWTWDPVWMTGQWPYGGEPFAQWNKWYLPGSLMTPATDAEVASNPYALFLDFLPPDSTLLGQTSDGTVGPLGFAKLIVNAGAFDKCVVRRVHERIIGRDIDPTTEAGYLDELTAEFIMNGRLVRPFVQSLTQSSTFRRGH